MIEVEVKVEKKQEEVLEFPCLMRSEETDAIILATGLSEDGINGVIIFEGSGSHRVRKLSNHWSIADFKLLPKNTEIKIKNK